MPLYEYQCEKCGKRFEVMQKFSDEPLTAHEACGGRVDRLISAPALQFKGSGWYITDYAKSQSGDNGAAKKTDTPSAASSSGSESGSSVPSSEKSESKSGTKAPASDTK